MFLISEFSLIFRSQLPALIQLVIASVLAHQLSQNDYGIFNLLKNIVIMCYAFVTFSFERTALSLHLDHSLGTITRNIIPIRIIIFLILPIPIFYYTLTVGISLSLIVLAICCLIPGIFDIKYSFDINQTVHKDITLTVVRALPLLAVVPISYFVADGNIILSAHFILLLAGYSLYVILQHLQTPKLLGKPELTHTKKFFALSNFAFMGSLTASFNIYVPTFLIETRIGLANLATYSVALTIFLGVVSICAMIVRIAVSQYLKSNQLKKELSSSLKRFLPLWLFITIAAVFWGKTFIVLIFGESYANAYASLLILLFGLSLAPYGMFFSNLLIAKGLTKEYMLTTLAAFLINIVTILIFIDILGIESAAVGMVMSLITLFVLGAYTFNRASRQATD